MTTLSNPLLSLIAENIDRLVNLDVSGYGVIGEIHQAARAHHGAPLAWTAAERLHDVLSDGGSFLVTCRWQMPGFYPYGETDGPIGAAILGRALGLAFGARMIVLTEEGMVPITTAACRAAGLNRPEIMHDVTTESRMLHRCIDAGGIDGFSCTPVPVTDGMVEAVHVGICALLNEMVRAPAAKLPSVFSTPRYKVR